MRVKKLGNETSEKFILAMLELIDETGGLTGVNLRMVSKRIGCAHTNAYNYFEGYDGLIFAAYDRAIILYGQEVVKGLEDIDDCGIYFITFIKNIINFALSHPGYYRFIGSDTFNVSGLASETIKKVIALKAFFLDTVYSVCQSNLTREASDKAANILMSYLDGELFNIINHRSFPDDQTETRMITNSIELINLFTSTTANGIDVTKASPLISRPVIPDFFKS